MGGRAAANVVEMGFRGDDAGITVGLPEERELEGVLALEAAAGGTGRKIPVIQRTRETLAAGLGKLSSAFSAGKKAKLGELESAAGHADDAQEAEPLGAEGSAVADLGASASPSKGRGGLPAVGLAIALGVVTGLAVVLMPGHQAPAVRGRLAAAAGGLVKPEGEAKADAHMVAPLASLSSVKPREAVPEPVEVLPKAAGENDLVAEIAALGPRAKDAGGEAKKQEGEAAAASVVAAAPEKEAGLTVAGVPAVSAPAHSQERPAAAGGGTAPVASNAPAKTASVTKAASAMANDIKAAPLQAPATVEVSEPGVKEKAAPAGKVAIYGAVLPAQEIELSGMITQLSAVVRKLGEEMAAMKVEQKRLAETTGGKLADFERRLSIGEAGRALDGAKAAVIEASLPVQPADAALSPVKPLPAPAKRGAPKGEPVNPEDVLHYRVRAASPGLAMLAAVDETGDEGKPVEVAVGGQVPGYGRVRRIAQRGLSWIVETEKGEIR